MTERAPRWRALTRLAAACAAALVVVLPGVAAPATASVPDDARPEDGVVVKLRDDAAGVDAGAAAGRVASAVKGRLVASLVRNRALVSVGKGSSLAEVLGQLARDPRVEWAEPNMRYRATAQPNDPCLSSPCGPSSISQWGPGAVRAPLAWDVTQGSSSVRVAVIDGGVDATHPELVGKVDVGLDLTGDPPDFCNEHGTHVAGTIAAATNNAVGVAGVGWNTRVLSLRTLSYDPEVDDCTGLLTAIALAIEHAVNQGVKVINLSLAGTFDSRTIRDSIRNAVRSGVVVVGAAGNEGHTGNPVEYPAAYPEVLAVAATTWEDKRAFFSNYGAWVDIAAPGYRIVSTMPGASYAEMSGTSMATPHVAAAAALVFARFPGISGFDVASRLQLGSDSITGTGTELRYGRLNMFRALATNGPGYYMVASDGGIFAFGESKFYGSTGSLRLNEPIFAMAVTPRRMGYWFVARDGGIFNYGDAEFFGSKGGQPLPAPIVGLAATPSGKGYWMAGATGAVYYFGDAKPFGSMVGRTVSAPIVGIVSTASGQGYWMVGSDGAVYAFGDAGHYGSMGGKPLNRPIVGMAATPSGLGYWLVATDGGIFAYGDAKFYGSTGSIRLNEPIVGMKPAPGGDGYWLVASDGGIFAYNVGFFGSMGGTPLNRPVVGIA